MKNLSEYDSVTENTTPHIKTTTPYFKIFTNALSDCKLIIKRVSVFGEREKCFFFSPYFSSQLGTISSRWQRSTLTQNLKKSLSVVQKLVIHLMNCESIYYSYCSQFYALHLPYKNSNEGHTWMLRGKVPFCVTYFMVMKPLATFMHSA